ncbi:hypothetical protein ARTSIC4J27_1768 [Pseudarthrobacter siccitolerans]|uniref:Uncharacterized protein n=1 Tax=Pseudarthrobacter siccitolerans TaxID=861266 RepID=A0A024H1B0_9MICC|nr:hypothetical protein ARTSIC4J27_1768 [Pseudarthrobacter siccitolerans]
MQNRRLRLPVEDQWGATYSNDGAGTAGNVNFLMRRNSPPELPQ